MFSKFCKNQMLCHRIRLETNRFLSICTQQRLHEQFRKAPPPQMFIAPLR